MKNSFLRTLYHTFVVKKYNIKTFRGGWMLTSIYVNDYKQKKASYLAIAKAHLAGWSYSDERILGVTNANRKHYLSTRDYCSLHPFNGSYSFWIDDKLTLKYILSGTKAGKYMPEYYFQISDNGSIIPLMDLDACYAMQGLDGIVSLLESKGTLAFKLIKSSLGVGFYRVEYNDGVYYMNGEKMNREQFMSKICSLRNYIVTEFLFPHPEIAKLCDKSVGCLRYIVGRNKKGEIQDIYSFMRFGTSKSKYVENYNSGGVLSIIHDGKYIGGNVLDFETNTNCKIERHPDNDVVLKGEIPHWDIIVQAAHEIADVMPQLSYMGIDFCITNTDKVKVIEINSLSSLDSLQTDMSIFDTSAGVFFRERLR